MPRRRRCPPKPPTVASRRETIATPSSFAVRTTPTMASALAVQGIVNHRRKAVARRAAVPAWRGTLDETYPQANASWPTPAQAGSAFWHDAVTVGVGGRSPVPSLVEVDVELVGQAHRPLRTGYQRLDRTPHLRRTMERSPNKRRQI